MHRAATRVLLLATSVLISHRASAQTAAPQAAAVKIEPGLEQAVKWKWWVAPSDEKSWGIPLPEPELPKVTTTPGGIPSTDAGTRPATYEVKKGDALAIIARKFQMKVDQLKQFNDLKDDRIRVGQVLKIPSLAEIAAMTPPPPPPKKEEETPKKKKKGSTEPEKPQELSYEAKRELENVKLQVFLDRENFSPGPIDGKSGTLFVKATQLYLTAHATDYPNIDSLKAKVEADIKEPYTRYTLKRDDFRFINPPRAVAAVAPKPATKGKSKSSAVKKDVLPALTYEELVASPFLGYRTPWEFLAERFHCDETFLRHINHNIKSMPAAGFEIQVPDVKPFEIEKAFDAPLQPAADEKQPVTAAIVDLIRLEISREGKLIAVMPLSIARPDLRGRGSWTVLDVIPRPRLATKQEVKEVPKVKATIGGLGEENVPTAKPVTEPALEKEQYLPPGPNNPLGILWINLAKAKTTEPLAYGLHGTSIPGQMSTHQSLGGIRLSNWDIARAVRLMPPGTPIAWKTR